MSTPSEIANAAAKLRHLLHKATPEEMANLIESAACGAENDGAIDTMEKVALLTYAERVRKGHVPIRLPSCKTPTLHGSDCVCGLVDRGEPPYINRETPVAVAEEDAWEMNAMLPTRAQQKEARAAARAVFDAHPSVGPGVFEGDEKLTAGKLMRRLPAPKTIAKHEAEADEKLVTEYFDAVMDRCRVVRGGLLDPALSPREMLESPAYRREVAAKDALLHALAGGPRWSTPKASDEQLVAEFIARHNPAGLGSMPWLPGCFAEVVAHVRDTERKQRLFRPLPEGRTCGTCFSPATPDGYCPSCAAFLMETANEPIIKVRELLGVVEETDPSDTRPDLCEEHTFALHALRRFVGGREHETRPKPQAQPYVEPPTPRAPTFGADPGAAKRKELRAPTPLEAAKAAHAEFHEGGARFCPSCSKAEGRAIELTRDGYCAKCGKEYGES